MAKNEGLKFKNGETSKPTLVIFDEVDGALESESHGAVNALLDFIFKGRKFKKGGQTMTNSSNNDFLSSNTYLRKTKKIKEI